MSSTTNFYDANELLKINHPGHHSMRVVCTHDGYDDMGPESNIWDLYVADKMKDGFLITQYHREDWFTDKCEPYVIHKFYSLKTEKEVATMFAGLTSY